MISSIQLFCRSTAEKGIAPNIFIYRLKPIYDLSPSSVGRSKKSCNLVGRSPRAYQRLNAAHTAGTDLPARHTTKTSEALV